MRNRNLPELKPPEYHPHLVEAVERALEPYKHILPPALIDEFRREALLQLTMHPVSAAMLSGIRPPGEEQRSGSHPKDAAAIERAIDDAKPVSGGSRPNGGRQA